jgi:hypothetical protein
MCLSWRLADGPPLSSCGARAVIEVIDRESERGVSGRTSAMPGSAARGQGVGE